MYPPQAVLSEALSGRHLDRHLDADEATVLGASLFAANLSTSFRLRKFGMVRSLEPCMSNNPGPSPCMPEKKTSHMDLLWSLLRVLWYFIICFSFSSPPSD